MSLRSNLEPPTVSEIADLPFYGHIIGTSETESGQGRSQISWDPWTLRPSASVALGGRDEADRAVAAAREAFDQGPWPRMGFRARHDLMHAWADLVSANEDLVALADVEDMGKPKTQALHDVRRSVANIRFFADHALYSASEVYPDDRGHHMYTRYEPAGVVLAIAPWNFPVMLETWKIAPALAWGNTVILKPAEDTPRSATLLGRLALEAGIPPGVLNVVHGFGSDGVGEALVADRRINRITFTGSSATGRAIAATAGRNLVPVSLELGGKGANVVFDDADIDNAVYWACEAIFRNAGQVCLAGSRLFVQEGVYAEFMEAFAKRATSYSAADPKDETTTFGPLASETHHRKVTGYLDTIDEVGATVRLGGAGEGLVVNPTILENVPFDAPHNRTEIFGPLAVVHRFTGEDEAIARANDTEFGLNAMVFTENVNRAHRVAAALKAGTIWVNCFFIRDLRAPFGGAGDSGLGREGGFYSRDFMTEPKAVILQIADAN